MKQLTVFLTLFLLVGISSCSSSSQDEPTPPYPATQIIEDIESHNEKILKDFFLEMTKGATSNNENENALMLLQNIGKYIDAHRGKRLPIMEALVYTDRDVRYDSESSFMVFTPKPTMVYGGIKISFKFNVGIYDENIIAKINHCSGFYLRGPILSVNAYGTLPSMLYDIDCNNTGFTIIPMGDPDIR